jgi:hypothetical protein
MLFSFFSIFLINYIIFILVVILIIVKLKNLYNLIMLIYTVIIFISNLNISMFMDMGIIFLGMNLDYYIIIFLGLIDILIFIYPCYINLLFLILLMGCFNFISIYVFLFFLIMFIWWLIISLIVHFSSVEYNYQDRYQYCCLIG